MLCTNGLLLGESTSQWASNAESIPMSLYHNDHSHGYEIMDPTQYKKIYHSNIYDLLPIQIQIDWALSKLIWHKN